MKSCSPSDAAREFEPFRDDVYRWAYRLLGRHHDALDVAQDVLVRWVRQRREDVPAQPRAWLRRVTTNRAIDVVRARRERPAADQAERHAGPFGGRSVPEAAELRDAVTDALTRLSEMQRTVLIAKVFDGQTFAQIAAEHALAVPTIKTHYLRAVRAVRDRLEREWSPTGDP